MHLNGTPILLPGSPTTLKNTGQVFARNLSADHPHERPQQAMVMLKLFNPN
jgi:hypothetical protein